MCAALRTLARNARWDVIVVDMLSRAVVMGLQMYLLYVAVLSRIEVESQVAGGFEGYERSNL